MEHDLGKPRKSTCQILKVLNQNIRVYGNIKYLLDIDKFTSYYKALWKDKNNGTQDLNFNREKVLKTMKLKRD
jgi:hypothetical protein